jgi:2-haloacid dehalogenase
MNILAFDVNETLLDLRSLDPLFEEALGDASLRPAWFQQMVQLAFVGAITDRYVDYTSAQIAALAMVAERSGIDLEPAAVERVVDGMRRLDPHPEVAVTLARLREGGFTVAALTNSRLEIARDQLRHAGLDGHFDEILSADDVRALKPRREAYEHAARTFGVDTAQVRLVAAHAWDCAGAMAAGCAAAFVARPGMVLSPVGQQPDIVGADLDEVADRILEAGR